MVTIPTQSKGIHILAALFCHSFPGEHDTLRPPSPLPPSPLPVGGARSILLVANE